MSSSSTEYGSSRPPPSEWSVSDGRIVVVVVVVSLAVHWNQELDGGGPSLPWCKDCSHNVYQAFHATGMMEVGVSFVVALVFCVAVSLVLWTS
jgi:hypothetical protein